MYRRDHLRLIVSGVGQAASAAATRGLSRLVDRPEGTRAWLNIGLAGHGQLPPGSLLTASAVIERTSEQRWPLTPVLAANLCSATTIVTEA